MRKIPTLYDKLQQQLFYSPSSNEAQKPLGINGAVTSPHYAASQAGLEVLKMGGTAVEAAIAAAATLSVVYPHMCGLGGDAFWLIYDANKKKLLSLNGSGKSAKQATCAYYTDKGQKAIPSRGIDAAITVPGVVKSWEDAYQYSKDYLCPHTKPLSWGQLLNSAMGYASEGFVVTNSLSKAIEKVTAIDRPFFNSSAFIKNFMPNGKIPRAGEVLRLPDLLSTLKVFAQNGPAEFYTGEIAQKICKEIQANNGLLCLDDFKDHSSDWCEPISTDYRGYKAFTCPPNSQGISALQILNILNNFEIQSLEDGSAEYIHLIVEATKLAFSDRDRLISDPNFSNIEADKLLSKDYGKAQAKLLNISKSSAYPSLLAEGGDTIWLGVVDKMGNAVSLIQSIYHEFGSGFIPEDTGVLLQNRGSFFSLNEQSVNKLEPNKRTLHTLCPSMLFKDNKPHLIYGTMGGEGQPQTQAALITRIIDFGLNPNDAIYAPRWLYGRSWGEESNGLRIEDRFHQNTGVKLKQMGHDVKNIESFSEVMGHAGVIKIDTDTNLKEGASDPRSDGQALAY